MSSCVQGFSPNLYCFLSLSGHHQTKRRAWRRVWLRRWSEKCRPRWDRMVISSQPLSLRACSILLSGSDGWGTGHSRLLTFSVLTPRMCLVKSCLFKNEQSQLSEQMIRGAQPSADGPPGTAQASRANLSFPGLSPSHWTQPFSSTRSPWLSAGF